MRPRLRRALAIAAVTAGVLGLGGRVAFVQATRVPPPEVRMPSYGPPVIEGQTARVGRSSLERRPGHWLMTHRGTPEEIGAAHALLGDWLNQRAEQVMFESLHQHVPAPFRPPLFALIKWQYRHMHRAIPERTLRELYAFSQAYQDRYAGFLPIYQRAVYYHTLHDITQELVGSPLVVACSSFAASGPATRDGRLLIGRNFDFEVFPIFDQEKVVHVFAPDGAIPFASVSWTGLAGVVTGMNAEGVFVSINAAWSEGRNRVGPPVSLLVRRVLEEARSLDEAVSLLEAHRTMVSDIYLVGDGETGQAAVVERGVERFGVRPLGPEGTVSATNHMLSPEFQGDTRDAALRATSTTEARYARLTELVARHRGALDVPAVASVLRDRRGAGDRELAPGHRDALDALLATHSVIADARARTLWVSQAPHLLGPYRRVDLLRELDLMGVDTRQWRRFGRDEEAAPGVPAAVTAPEPAGEAGAGAGAETLASLALGEGDLPADPFYTSGRYEAWLRQREYLREGRAYLDQDAPAAALDLAARAEALFPGDPEVALLRADAHRVAGDTARAVAEYRRFLEAGPARGRELEEARAFLAEHGGRP